MGNFTEICRVVPLNLFYLVNSRLHLLFSRIILVFRKPLKSKFMKPRIRKVINFFTFNVLFFSMYLNFIHTDKVVAESPTVQQNNGALNTRGTVFAQNPRKYSNNKGTSEMKQIESAKLSIK